MKNANNNSEGIGVGTVLLTGGCGYIGSHVCVELLDAGYEVVVVDNLQNSSATVLGGVSRISGHAVRFERGDIREPGFLENVIAKYDCDSVIHFAGVKSVGESVERPLEYYDNNVGGTVRLLAAMSSSGVRNLVFSSSATVYGEPESLPIPESHPRSAGNPYGRTKLIVEDLLRDLYSSDERWRVCILRYFNPAGAHQTGLIGERPCGVPNNLVPYVCQVAAGERKQLRVWGSDYSTRDGTGVRDYIHVVDLAKGHVRALEQLSMMRCRPINLGRGHGYSVLEVVAAFEKVSGKRIPYELCSRRSGDVASCYADASLAAQLLGWKANYDLEDICRDAWRWEMNCKVGKRGAT